MTSDGEGEAIDEQPIRWGREAPLEERLRALADFVPIFKRPGFEFQLRSSDHHAVYSAEAHRFIEVAYELRWVRPFDWPSWIQTAEAAPFKHAEGIVSTSSEQLARAGRRALHGPAAISPTGSHAHSHRTLTRRGRAPPEGGST